MKLLDCFMRYFSIEELDRKRYIRYKLERSRLETLSAEELSSKYIYLKAKHAHKKRISCFLNLLAVFVILPSSCSFIYNLATNLSRIWLREKSAEVVVLAMIAGILFLYVVFITLAVVIACNKEIQSLHLQLLLMEEVREKERIDKLA